MSTFSPFLPALFLGFYERNRERPSLYSHVNDEAHTSSDTYKAFSFLISFLIYFNLLLLFFLRNVRGWRREVEEGKGVVINYWGGRAAIFWAPIWGGLKFSEPAFRRGLQFSGRLWAMCTY